MKYPSIIVLSLLTIISLNVFSSEFDQLLQVNGFKEFPIPVHGRPDWSEANSSPVTYYIKELNGKITINTKGDSAKGLLTFKTKNITYQGTNRGEWGGKLTAIFSDGKEKELINDNIVSIIRYPPKHLTTTDENSSSEDGKPVLYVFTGLAHLNLSSGAIYVIHGYENNPSVKRLTLLPDAPYVVITDKNYRGNTHFFIIGPETVTSYAPAQDRIKVLLIDQFWRGMYPTSGIVKNNEILLGMRSGVVIINLTQGKKGVRYFRKSL